MLSIYTLESLLSFRKERDWEKFHSARNLAAAISIEASELQEHFLWTTDKQAEQISSANIQGIAEEIADIAIFLSYLAYDLSIDLDSAVQRKIEANRRKYPADKARGSNKKYTQL